MSIWNPWRGCIRYSEGCKYCYIHMGDMKRGIDTANITKTKDFDKPRQQLNTTKYNTIRRKMYHLNPKIEKATSTERKNLIKEKNSLKDFGTFHK